MTTQRNPFDITSPCDADWESMTPAGEGTRRCAGCDELVYDVASLDPTAAAAAAADPATCLRVTRTTDGRIVTRGRLAVLAASLVLMPAAASAGPRDPLVNHQPTEADLERGRAQAAKNRLVLNGTLHARPQPDPRLDAQGMPKELQRPKVFLGRRS